MALNWMTAPRLVGEIELNFGAVDGADSVGSVRVTATPDRLALETVRFAVEPVGLDPLAAPKPRLSMLALRV
jgi:hypothetical protein